MKLRQLRCVTCQVPLGEHQTPQVCDRALILGTDLLAPDLEPHRVHLLPERPAVTHKFDLYLDSGEKVRNYLTYGCFPDGRLAEVFIRTANYGSTYSGLLDAVAISVSVGLQYGIPLKVYVDQFRAMKFEPSGFTPNEAVHHAHSVLDYVARWLWARFGPKEVKTS